MKFRKKPVIIDATQWHKPDLTRGLFMEEKDELGVYLRQVPDAVLGGKGHGEQRFPQKPKYIIDTLEGTHDVTDGDWIITGVKGEKYPCKPDIFEMTYEKVE